MASIPASPPIPPAPDRPGWPSAPPDIRDPLPYPQEPPVSDPLPAPGPAVPVQARDIAPMPATQ